LNPSLTQEILSLSLQHLRLVGITIAIAAGLALPAAVLLARRPAARRWVLGFTNIAQTVPSLALFGFLLPLIGIGEHTAKADERQ
jgi:osmoprotectant transport system permease protein